MADGVLPSSADIQLDSELCNDKTAVAILEQANLSFTNRTVDVNKFQCDFGDGGFSELENQHPIHRALQLFGGVAG